MTTGLKPSISASASRHWLIVCQLLPVDKIARSAWTFVFGDHHEHGRVDRVHAFAQDRPLPAALAAARRRQLRETRAAS